MDLLQKGGVDEPERQRYLDICWRNLLKLEKQINDLLDLARLSQGSEQFEMLPVDLAALVSTEAENLRPLADANKVTISVNFADRVMVKGNPEKLTQLVDNLLLNAVKYNKRGGEVQAGFEDLGTKKRLVITDSGIGMEREHLGKIFNRFYRADISGTGRIEGLGIGLSLVQEIVQLHNGDISVESQPGEGTSFTVETGVRIVTPKKPLILLIEDDPDTAELYQAMLKSEGMQVVSCQFIKEARDWWDTTPRLPDLVVTDVLLPDGNGLELLGSLEWPGGGCPPALVLSAHGDPRMPARCRKAGGAVFLDKLKGLQDLIPQVKRLVSHQRRS